MRNSVLGWTDGQTDGQSTSACVELRFAAKKFRPITYTYFSLYTTDASGILFSFLDQSMLREAVGSRQQNVTLF